MKDNQIKTEDLVNALSSINLHDLVQRVAALNPTKALDLITKVTLANDKEIQQEESLIDLLLEANAVDDASPIEDMEKVVTQNEVHLLPEKIDYTNPENNPLQVSCSND